jgi:hypothetical protein
MVQLVWEAREAKHSLMQSQDCIRLMASSAAATEARANQLQDQLETVHHFLLNCWASAVHHFSFCFTHIRVESPSTREVSLDQQPSHQMPPP